MTSLSMTIQQHHEKIIFDIVFMTKHDKVLKIPWLKKHNSDVNWKKKNIYMKKTSKHENVIDALTEFDDWWDIEF